MIDSQIENAKTQLMKMEEKGMENNKMYAFTEKGLQMLEIKKANIWSFSAVEIITTLLCLFGAMEMRKRKKTGYFYWLIGEFSPYIFGIIVVGTPGYIFFVLVFYLR